MTEVTASGGNRRANIAGVQWSTVFGETGDISSRLYWRLFIAVTFLGAAFRFWDLGGHSLWMDEGVTHVWSQLPLDAILFGQIDNHPPLPYVIQHFWQQIFPSADMGRIPSALAGLATVLVVTAMGRDLISRRAGIMAGLFLAVCTGHIYFSQEMRMYALLVLGLTVATWGALGQARGGQLSSRAYAVLYVTGGAVAIYSQMIGLIAMALIGGSALVALYLGDDRWVGVRSWFRRNLILLLVTLPWLAQIPFVAGAFSGVESTAGIMDAQWFFRNMTGFPGLLGFSLPVELLLYGLVGVSAPLAWMNGRRALALSVVGLVIVFPIAMVALNMRQPILVNRVMTPAVIGVCLGAAYAIAQIRHVRAGTVIAALLATAGLVSSVFEISHRNKPEDYRGAYAFADAHGYQEAAVVTCIRFTTTAAHEYRPDAPLYLYQDEGVIRYHDHEYWNAIRMSLKAYHKAAPAEIDAYLGGGWLVSGGLAEAVAAHDQVIFVRPFCAGDGAQTIDTALQTAGFVETHSAHITGKATAQTLIEPPLTRVTLYSKATSLAGLPGDLSDED